MSHKKTTKLIFLAVGDVLYDNGYKSRIFGEMKIVDRNQKFDKYFISFEKKDSYQENQRMIRKMEEDWGKSNWKAKIFSRHNQWKIDSIRDTWQLLDYLQEIKYEGGIIHAQSIYACYMALQIKNRFKKTKVIFDMHGLVGPELIVQNKNIIIRWMTQYVENMCIKNADLLITASRSLKNYTQKRYNKKEVTALPCLADEKYFQKVDWENIQSKRKRFGINSDKPVACYLGGMQTWQNFPRMIDFVKKNNLYFLVITNEPNTADQMLRQSLAENDYLVLDLPHSQVYQYLQLADGGLLLRDKNELNRIAFPTKAAEYWLCGLPIIHNGTIDDIKNIAAGNNLGVDISRENWKEWWRYYHKNSHNVKAECRQYALDNLIWKTRRQTLNNIYRQLAQPSIFYLITSGFWGGAQKYTWDLANYFKNKNCQVTIGFGSGEQSKLWKNKMAEKKIEITRFEHLQRNINPWRDILALYEIYTCLKKKSPDIVHISSSKAGILGRVAARLVGMEKVFYTAHGWVFNEKIAIGKKWFYLLLEKMMQSWTDKIFCVSEFDRQAALKYGFDRSKIKVIYNGIDEDKGNNK